MTQSDSDGLPTMGNEAEAELLRSQSIAKAEGFACSCGQPDRAGVMHRQDGPCTVVEETQRVDVKAEWLQRLEREHYELDQKGMALHAFITRNSAFHSLAPRDQTLLTQQMETMGVYYAILNERLFRAKNPAIAAQADEAELKERQQANLDALETRLQ